MESRLVLFLRTDSAHLPTIMQSLLRQLLSLNQTVLIAVWNPSSVLLSTFDLILFHRFQLFHAEVCFAIPFLRKLVLGVLCYVLFIWFLWVLLLSMELQCYRISVFRFRLHLIISDARDNPRFWSDDTDIHCHRCLLNEQAIFLLRDYMDKLNRLSA